MAAVEEGKRQLASDPIISLLKVLTVPANCTSFANLAEHSPESAYRQLAFDHASLLNDRLFRQDMELHDSAMAAMDFDSHYNLLRPDDEASFQNWASMMCDATMCDHQQ
ncbi:hypothetical protein ABZP36_008849 [Zizania latifolia]